MTLRQLLQEKRDAIARNWLKAILATYPGNTAALFASEQDRFANPVGHSLRVGSEGILDAVLDSADVEELREHLRAIIKIRAIQQFAPSQALEFVFRLKEVFRAELGEAAADPKNSAELGELDAQIDRFALLAFDVYVECREQVYELRINDFKRRVSWIVDKVNRQDPELELVQIETKRKRDGGSARSEGLR